MCGRMRYHVNDTLCIISVIWQEVKEEGAVCLLKGKRIYLYAWSSNHLDPLDPEIVSSARLGDAAFFG